MDWDAAEGSETHEQFRASGATADPEYFAGLQSAGVLRPTHPGEERTEHVALGLTVDRGRFPHRAW